MYYALYYNIIYYTSVYLNINILYLLEYSTVLKLHSKFN